MTCSLYKDFTRGCIEKFPKIMSSVTFDFCDSDNYKICPFYKIIIEKRPYCKSIEDCASQFLNLIRYISRNPKTYGRIMQLVDQYCLSENNNENCARKKLMKSGKKIPKNLLQDGSRLKFREILF